MKHLLDVCEGCNCFLVFQEMIVSRSSSSRGGQGFDNGQPTKLILKLECNEWFIKHVNIRYFERFFCPPNPRSFHLFIPKVPQPMLKWFQVTTLHSICSNSKAQWMLRVRVASRLSSIEPKKWKDLADSCFANRNLSTRHAPIILALIFSLLSSVHEVPVLLETEMAYCNLLRHKRDLQSW